MAKGPEEENCALLEYFRGRKNGYIRLNQQIKIKKNCHKKLSWKQHNRDNFQNYQSYQIGRIIFFYV